MKLKSITTSLIIFSIGFIVGWFVGWSPTLENLKGLVINGWIMVFAILAFITTGSDILGHIINFINRRQDKTAEIEAKRLGEKIEHSERLVKNNISLRIDSKIIYVMGNNGLRIQENTPNSLEFIKWSPWLKLI